MIEIDVYSNTVVIAGQVVIRPLRLSPKQWLDFWDQVKDPESFLKQEYDKGYLDGEQAGKESTWDNAYNDGYAVGVEDAKLTFPSSVPHK